VTRWCAKRRISPNVVTWVSLGCVLLATWLFWHGWFLTGLAFAWGMCFLDTVDGKLARCTLTSTKLGDVFDHGIDLLHPPFWYYAWFVGLGPYLAVEPRLGVVGGDPRLHRRALAGRLFIWRYGIEIHTWRPVDSWFRLITARRNPNLLILMVCALLQAPDKGWSRSRSGPSSASSSIASGSAKPSWRSWPAAHRSPGCRCRRARHDAHRHPQQRAQPAQPERPAGDPPDAVGVPGCGAS
jgi:hypothetical protein